MQTFVSRNKRTALIGLMMVLGGCGVQGVADENDDGSQIEQEVETTAFVQGAGINHLISIEAENFHRSRTGSTGDGWAVTSTMAEESGTAYMEVNPNNGSEQAFSSSQSAWIVFDVRFLVSGAHALWIRSAACGAANDSVHIGFDTAALVTDWATPTGCKWTWAKQNVTIPTAGHHTVHVAMDEDGFKIDKLVLTTNDAYDPSTVGGSKGPAESAHAGMVASPNYSVGGTISGLQTGKSAVLTINGSDNLVLGANSQFIFPTRLVDGTTYTVAVLAQPTGQTCTLTNATGTLAGANKADVTVTCTSTTPPPATSTLIFNPGHYFMPSYNTDGTVSNRATFFNAVNTYNFRGAQMRYEWVGLESTQGNYTFENLDADLAQLGAGKQLFLLIEIRQNGGHAVPLYMRDNPTTGTYKGGEIGWNNTANQSTADGYFANLSNVNVRNRLQALITAMAAHLTATGTISKVEGVGFVESSMGYPLAGKPAFDEVGYFNGYVTALGFFNASFPNRVNYQFLNWPRSRLNIVASQLFTMKAGLGTPDTFVGDDTMTMAGNTNSAPYQGIYQYYFQLYDKVPTIASIQPQNFHGNRHPTKSPSYQPTLQELRDFAANQMHANYLIWTMTRATWAQYGAITYPHVPEGHLFWQDVLDFMQLPAQANTPAGGLNTTLPTCFAE